MAYPLVEAEYPIAAVSKLTGVSCHALRVWERRYGFPVPHRTAAGHRRYAADQVMVLRRLSDLAASGRPIGELIAQVRGGRLSAESTPSPTLPGLAAEHEEGFVDLLDRLLAGDIPGADVCIDRLEAALGVEDLVARVIAPALTEAGERWFRRRCAVFQERCVTGYLRRKLDGLISSASGDTAATGPTVLVGTVQGDRHEGGALIAHLLLTRAGWRVINLGVDLPVAEYARAVDHLRPDALALSFVLSRNINKRFQELAVIRGVPIFVGGRSILNHQGLARRFGFSPVPGPAAVAVGQMRTEFEAWRRRGGPGRASG